MRRKTFARSVIRLLNSCQKKSSTIIQMPKYSGIKLGVGLTVTKIVVRIFHKFVLLMVIYQIRFINCFQNNSSCVYIWGFKVETFSFNPSETSFFCKDQTGGWNPHCSYSSAPSRVIMAGHLDFWISSLNPFLWTHKSVFRIPL